MKSTLGKISTDTLLSELKRRKSTVTKLSRRRMLLLAKVVAVEEQIRLHGGEIKNISASSRGGRRPRNTKSLPDTMASVMSKTTPMSAGEIEAAVTKAGYRSTSSTFKTIIFQALAKDKRFKKADRGQYVLR
jgi:hypothetical protein